MSTARDATERPAPGTEQAGTQPNDAGVADDGLVAETTAFVATFERWSSRKAAGAGASVPRLKLLYSIHCHGPQKMADLAGILGTTPRNVTAIVDNLEADGLVRRTPHSTDRRVTLIELTCKRDAVAEQFGAYQRSVGELFADVDVADLEAFARVLAIVRSRMHQDDARRPSDA